MNEHGVCREMTFEEEKKYYQKRVCEVFNGYSNSYGAEDPLEICVIRDGYRAICKASERINQLEAEIERVRAKNREIFQEALEIRENAIKEFAESVINDILPEFMKGHEEMALKISFEISQKAGEYVSNETEYIKQYLESEVAENV